MFSQRQTRTTVAPAASVAECVGGFRRLSDRCRDHTPWGSETLQEHGGDWVEQVGQITDHSLLDRPVKIPFAREAKQLNAGGVRRVAVAARAARGWSGSVASKTRKAT
jgi:hypothetical protein